MRLDEIPPTRDDFDAAHHDPEDGYTDESMAEHLRVAFGDVMPTVAEWIRVIKWARSYH